MISKLTRKAILKTKEMIENYGKEMSVIQEKIAIIDEKYQKLIEKETKELKETLASLEEEQEIWNSSLSRYDAEIVAEVLGENSSVSDEDALKEKDEKEEQQEQVVDTLFEENNEPESETESSTTVEVAPEIPVTKEEDFEKTSTEESSEPAEPKSEEQKSIDDLWPDSAPAEGVKEEVPVFGDDSNQWEDINDITNW